MSTDSKLTPIHPPLEARLPQSRLAGPLPFDNLPAVSRRRLKSKSAVLARALKRYRIYTRYSTDKQEVKSEERQINDCKAYVNKKGAEPDHVNSDRGKSGTGMSGRAQLQEMLANARLKKFDVLVVEDLDRLSRRLPDALAIFYELKLLGIEIHDIQNGKLDLIHVIIRGYMGEEGRIRFLALSRAGKQNAARNGKMVSKVAYGYRRDPHNPETGIHLIDKDNARRMEWIIRAIADGMSAHALARILTKQGVLPPAQALTVANGGQVGKIKPWHGSSVIKLVRNHIYVGFVTWDTTTAVHDPETGGSRRVQTDKSQWIVVDHPELRIVDFDTWTRANLRLSAFAFEAPGGGPRFLLTGKVFCTCGANLRTIAQEQGSRYFCSGRALASTNCNVADYHRLEWVEQAVVEPLLRQIFDPPQLKPYAEAFRAGVADILKADVQRRNAIDRRLEEIRNLQLTSLSKTSTEGFSPQRVITMRQDLETEAGRLATERVGLKDPADFAGSLRAVESFRLGFDRIMSEIPFRPDDAEGIAMAQALRDALGRVVVHACDASGFTRVEIEIDFLQRFRQIGAADAPPMMTPLGRIILESGFHPKALRKAARAARMLTPRMAVDEAAAEGRYDLTDAQWAIVAPLFDGFASSIGSAIDSRLLVNGLFCIAKAGGPLAHVPSRFGEGGPFWLAAKRLAYSGRWDDCVEALREADAACLDGAPLDGLVYSQFPRRTTGKDDPDAATAARDREKLLTLSRAEKPGDPVRLRCEAIAMVLGGSSIVKAARAFGISASSAYHHWENYKDGGVNALGRRRRTGKKSRLAPDQIRELLAFAQDGFDPDDSDRPITYPILCRIAQERYGVEYSRSGMIQLCTRQGVPIGPIVARLRRDRRLMLEPNYSIGAQDFFAPVKLAVRRATPSSRAERRKLGVTALRRNR